MRIAREDMVVALVFFLFDVSAQSQRSPASDDVDSVYGVIESR